MGNQDCRLCGANHDIVLFEKAGILYYRCLNCGFVFSRPEINANIANKLDDYEAAYLDYLADSADDQRNFTFLLNWMRKFCPVEGRRILDVGAGSGKFVRLLRERGNSAYGLEPANPVYSEFLAKEPFFFCNFIEGFNEDSIGGKVDILVSWDVIEHMENPAVFLQNASRVIKPGGMLFLSTPDAGSFLARILGKRWYHYNKYHLSYFSRRRIVACAAQYGLHEVGFAWLPRLKSVRYILQYLNDFVFGSECLNLPKQVVELTIPVNLYDMMYVAFVRE